MKEELEMFLSQMDFDAQTIRQVKDLLAVQQNKLQKAQAQRKKQWERAVKKRQVYQAFMQGIARAAAEKESMHALFTSMEMFGPEDFLEMENKQAELADYLKFFEMEVDQIKDFTIFEQWIEMKQNQSAINFLGELQGLMDLK